MPAPRRFGALVLGIAITLIPMTSVHASTSDDLAAARQRLADARSAATAAAADFAAAESQYAALDNQINALEAKIDADKARAATLQDAARRRAVYAYTHAGDDIDLIVSSGDAEQAIRRTELLSHANQKDNTAVKQLAAVTADLRADEAIVKTQRAAQQKVKDELDARNRDLQAKVTGAQQAANNLEAQLAREQAAAAAAEAGRIAAERAQLAASRSGTFTGGAGQIIVNPGGGSFMCPVAGAAYTDDFGGPRGHPGNDLFVPTGTPAVAVKAGSVFYMANDGAGGNEAYLNANDGNTYFYAHLSQFVGAPRSVSQGEIVGLTGMTGNASAPHLHFEIRLGGVNGQRIDPYPTLRSAGC